MATIQTSIALYDGVTAPLRSMQRAMDVVLNSFEAMQNISGNSVNTASITDAQSTLSRLNDSINSLDTSRNVSVAADVTSAQSALSRLSDSMSNLDTRRDMDITADITEAQNALSRLSGSASELDEQSNIRFTADIAEAQRKLATLKGALSDTSGRIELDSSSLQFAREELAKSAAAFDGIEENIKDCTAAQKGFNASMDSGTNIAEQLWGKIKGAAATLGVGKAVKELTSLSDKVTGTTARLNFIVDDGGSVEELEQKIMASAQRSRAAYLDTADAIASMGANAGSAFSSNDELIAFMEQINKQFAIGGASAQGQAAAMLQLTQAMSMGALRGEELNSILENAPGIARAIESYMGIAEGSIKSYASEGAVTAEIVKNALLSAANDTYDETGNLIEGTNSKFEAIPKTWSQIMTDMQNKALSVISPILEKINDLANTQGVQAVANGIVDSLVVLSTVAGGTIDILSGGLDFVANNWSVLEPIILGVAAAYLTLKGATLAFNAAQAVSNGIKTISATLDAISAARAAMVAGATLAQAAATKTAAGAQIGLNAALLASPVTWVVAGVIAVVAAFYAVIAVINKVTGASISATGIITGIVATGGAFVLNVAIGTLNSIVAALYTIFVYPFLSIIEWVLNAANGGFNDFGSAVANLIGQIAGWFLSLGQIVTTIIDAIFGTDWTSGLEGLKSSVTSWGKNENAITIDGKNEVMKAIDYRVDYGDAFGAGYDFGGNLASKVGGLFDASQNDPMGAYNLANTLDTINGAAQNTAANTSKTANKLDITSEDLKYLRDIAEREAINRFTTAEIKVEQHNENHIASDTDLDGIMNIWATDFAHKLDVSAEGVHE